MLDIGRYPDGVTLLDFVGLLAFTLDLTVPFDDQEGLASRMRVPPGAGLGVESARRAGGARRPIRPLNDPGDKDVAGKMVLRPWLGLSQVTRRDDEPRPTIPD
jgi:hypothetical protein